MIAMAAIEKKSLIGIAARVAGAKNASLIGLAGVIIDETKYTIIIKTKDGVKTVPKDGIVLELPQERLRVRGGRLLGRPEERIKKRSR